MTLSEDIKAQQASEIVKPASTSIEGNSVTRRGLAELTAAQQAAAANEAGQAPNLGIRRTRFRHRGPAGGP